MSTGRADRTVSLGDMPDLTNLSLFTNDDSTFYQHTPKLPASERYATRKTPSVPLGKLDRVIKSLGGPMVDSGLASSCGDVFAYPRTSSRSPSLNSSRVSKRSSRSSRASSVCSCQSVRTERYLYHDRDDDYTLIETRFVPLNGELSQDLNCSVHSQDTTLLYDWRDTVDLSRIDDDVVVIPHQVAALSNTEIHARLAQAGDVPGPVTDSTCAVYMKRLVMVEKDPTLAGRNVATSSPG